MGLGFIENPSFAKPADFRRSLQTSRQLAFGLADTYAEVAGMSSRESQRFRGDDFGREGGALQPHLVPFRGETPHRPPEGEPPKMAFSKSGGHLFFFNWALLVTGCFVWDWGET